MMRRLAFFLAAVAVLGGLACEYEGGLGAPRRNTLTLTLAPSATEGDGVRVGYGTVSIPRVLTEDLVVNLASSDETELTVVPATVTIIAGDTSASFDPRVENDGDTDGTQTVTVTASLDGWTSGSDTIDILDDEPVPTVEWDAPDQAVSEGAGTVTVAVSLSAECTYVVSVPFTVSGDAVSPDDHDLADGSVDIPAGDVASSLSFNVMDDADVETSKTGETVILTMGTPAGADLGATPVHTVTIADNDAAQTVEWSAAAQTVGEDVGSVTVTATLSTLAWVDVTVPFTVSGTAVPADHDLADGSIVIAIGTSENSVTFNVVDDLLDEEDETVVLTMGGPTNAVLGTTTVHTVTITDDDTLPTVEWTAGSQTVGEDVVSVTVTATLSALAVIEATVPFTVSGTTVPADHDLADGNIVIEIGESENSVTFNVVDDVLDEEDETVVLTMGAPTNAVLGATTVHTVTITDDDTLPTVEWTAGSQPVAEDVVSVTVTATLSALAVIEATVPFTVSGTATAADHNLTDGSIVIAIGTSANSVTFNVVDDLLDEEDETVVLTMGAPTNAVLGATTVHTVTITDDDPLPSVEWSSASQDVGENVGAVTVTAMLSPVSGRDVTVPYQVAGDATNPADHDIADDMLTIVAGDSTGSVTFTVVDDGDIEADEFVTLTIDTPTNAVVGATDVHTVTILDNDAAELVMTALSGPASANASDDINLSDTVRNTGGLDAGSFEVKFYLSSDTTILPGLDPPMGSRTVADLAASGTDSMITLVTVPSVPDGIYYIGGIVDALGSVVEADEANNTYVSGGTIDIGGSGIGMDSYETDNTYDEATPIAVDGAPQAHTLHAVGDRDWLEIFISGAVTIVIETDDLTNNVQTMLFLYDSDGTTLLAENRDGGEEFGEAKIVWTFNTPTTCYVKVKHPGIWGNPGDYNISVTTFSAGFDVDLEMQNVSASPSNALAGDTVYVDVGFQNLGTSDSAPFRVGIYISDDAIIDGGDTLMDSILVAGLGAGEWQSCTRSVTIPLTTPDGDIWFWAIVDDPDEVTETDEGNNVLAAVDPVGIGMDIKVSFISVPSPASEGSMIDIGNTVYNNGGCPLNNVAVKIYLSPDADIDWQSDQQLGSRWISGPLAPGTPDTDVTSVTLPGLMESGTYYIGVVAYKSGMGPWEWAPEKDYTNNILSDKITITGSNWPDLVVTKATVTPLTVDPGDSLDVTDVTENAGSDTTGVASETRYYLAADPELWWWPTDDLGSRAVPALDPGVNDPGGATVTVPVGTWGGTFYLVAGADGGGIVTETDEENNMCAAADMVSVLGPDMDEPWNDAIANPGLLDPFMKYPRPYTFHTPGDMDWFQLNFFGPGTYTVETSNLLFGADTVIALYELGEETPIMTDDDGGAEASASKVTFEVPDTTIQYRLLVTHASNGTGHYKIEIREGP